jgi:hypothetical protein
VYGFGVGTGKVVGQPWIACPASDEVSAALAEETLQPPDVPHNSSMESK